MISQRIDKAIRVAAKAHRNQNRKGGDIPYIVHPFSVMTIANTVTDDEDILIACLFHDILEDVPEEYSKERMREEFGDRVVSIVEGVTKNGELKDWQEVSEDYLANLREEDEASVIVSGADKIHNLQSVLIDYEDVGDKLWERFTKGKDSQVWWYKSILEILEERIPESPLTTKLDELVQKLDTITSN